MKKTSLFWIIYTLLMNYQHHLFLFFLFPLLGYSQIDNLYSDSISVNVFLLDECRISQHMTVELNDLYSMYESDKIQFTGYFPNFSSKPDKIDLFAEKYKISFPLKTDYFKSRSKMLGATVAPEVVVYDEKHERILYAGRIDNSYDKIGSKRRIVTSRDLRSALQYIQENEEIDQKHTTAIGCFINFNEL